MKTEQAELDFAREHRDVGVARAEAGAKEAWLVLAYAALVAHLRAHGEFFVDDLWRSGLERPRESRALGAVVQRAARERLMEKTGEYRQSRSSNLSPKPVWRSLIRGRA